MVLAYVPGAQREHEVPPGLWRYLPVSHARHVDSDVEFLALLYRPDGHGVQTERSLVALYLPSVQMEQ